MLTGKCVHELADRDRISWIDHMVVQIQSIQRWMLPKLMGHSVTLHDKDRRPGGAKLLDQCAPQLAGVTPKHPASWALHIFYVIG